MNYCYNCFCEKTAPGPCPKCGYDPAFDEGKFPLALPHGSILAGQYVTGRVLGQGGFGVTYLAFDRTLTLKVAIKEFFPDTMAGRTAGSSQVTAFTGERGEQFRYGLERFLDEARTLAKFLGNPNIVGVRSYFEENGTAYFVMEYVEGVSLKAHLKNSGGKIPWQEAVRILLPVMDALSAVHREGIIHRDIAPDNIYLTGSRQVKLLDFGAARYSLGDKSQSLDVVLKHGYAPKEQYTRRGRQGPFSDVYALAATFYASVTGYVPPDALDRLEEDDLVPPSARGVHMPPALEDAILRGLEVSAQDRFQSMEEFAAAVREAAKQEEQQREEEQTPYQPPVQQQAAQTSYQPPVQQQQAAQQTSYQPPVQQQQAAQQTSYQPPVQQQTAQTSYQPPVQQQTAQQTSYQPPVQQQTAQQTSYQPPVQQQAQQTSYQPPVQQQAAQQPSYQPPVQPQGNHGSHKGLIAGICAGAVLLLILAVILWPRSTVPVDGGDVSPSSHAAASRPVSSRASSDTPSEEPPEESASPALDPAEPVSIENESLDFILREAFEKGSGEEFLAGELASIRNISICTYDVLEKTTFFLSTTEKTVDLEWEDIFYLSDISDFQYFTGCEKIQLYYQDVSDLSPLRNLEALASLDVTGNPVTDFSPLLELDNLHTLIVNETGLSDLSGLSGLTQLTELRASINSVTDLGPLTELTNLRTLWISANDISDLTPLSGLEHLMHLYIGGNEISDLSPLSNLENLSTLSVWSNKISDLSPLSGMTQLENLDLNSNQITDLSPLSKLTNVSEISLDYNAVADLSPLSGMISLRKLSLQKNQVSDLSPLSDLPYLSELNLTDNPVDDWSPVASVEEVKGRPE